MWIAWPAIRSKVGGLHSRLDTMIFRLVEIFIPHQTINNCIDSIE